CRVETYPAHHDSYDDFETTLMIALEYAKTVTLIETGDLRTDAVMAKNRRIGCSLSGVVQAIDRHGYRRMLEWCQAGYQALKRRDAELSRRLCVPRSIKLTSIKPSGTVSLLA